MGMGGNDDIIQPHATVRVSGDMAPTIAAADEATRMSECTHARVYRTTHVKWTLGSGGSWVHGCGG